MLPLWRKIYFFTCDILILVFILFFACNFFFDIQGLLLISTSFHKLIGILEYHCQENNNQILKHRFSQVAYLPKDLNVCVQQDKNAFAYTVLAMCLNQQRDKIGSTKTAFSYKCSLIYYNRSFKEITKYFKVIYLYIAFLYSKLKEQLL